MEISNYFNKEWIASNGSNWIPSEKIRKIKEAAANLLHNLKSNNNYSDNND